MFRIGELSERTGVPRKTVRYYEEVGVIPPAERAANGYRMYDDRAVENLHFIRRARTLDFTLDDIAEILAFRERGEAPCDYVLGVVREQIERVETRIRDLIELRDELTGLYEAGQQLPKDVRMEACVCHLIKAGVEPPAGQEARTTVNPETARGVHQHILRTFAERGAPPSPEAIKAHFNLPDRATVEDYLSAIEAQGGLHRDAQSGDILAAYPFSASATPHRVRLADGNMVYAMCAIDALGIPFMLDTDADIHSVCEHCGREITLSVSRGGLSRVAPDETTVVYNITSGECVAATDQCPFINYFCSLEHARLWADHHADRTLKILALPEALEHGRRIFGGLLRPEAEKE